MPSDRSDMAHVRKGSCVEAIIALGAAPSTCLLGMHHSVQPPAKQRHLATLEGEAAASSRHRSLRPSWQEIS